MDPRDVVAGLGGELQENLLPIVADYEVSGIGQNVATCCRIFEALGAARFLATRNVDSFKECLTQSGYARRYFLRRASQEQVSSSRFRALKFGKAVLACLAANDRPLAYEIASLSAAEPVLSVEYEDDFCFIHFVNLTVRDLTGEKLRNKRQEVLDRFERVVVEGGEANQYRACAALLAADAAGFGDALTARIEEIVAANEELRQRLAEPGLERLLFWPSNFVSIEAIAMLKLAKWSGMTVAGEFALCPCELVNDAQRLEVEDPFYEMDQLRVRARG